MAKNLVEINGELNRVSNLHTALSNIDAALAPALSRLDDGALSAVERAKVDSALAYTVSSLYYVLLKTKGIDTAGHEVMTSLKKVGQTMAVIKKAGADEAASSGNVGADGRGSSSGHHSTASAAPTEQPRLRVDAAAGKRMVTHALAANATLASGTASTEPAPPGASAAAPSGAGDGSSTTPGASPAAKKRKKKHKGVSGSE